MIDLDPGVVAVLAVASATLSLLLLVAVAALGLRLRVVRRGQVRAFRGVEADVVVALGRHADELQRLSQQLRDGRADIADLRGLLRRAVSRVGLVRYDAFDDMGGALSFSAALLDERGDGIVVSAINGRSETRCYAKPVAAGTSEHTLSGEEVTAIDSALGGHPASIVPPDEGRRRRRAS